MDRRTRRFTTSSPASAGPSRLARVLTGVTSCSRASGTPVARSGRHAVLADDREPAVRAETAVARVPREGVEPVDDPGVPSFGRTLGLPSAWSIPIRALRRECDPVNVHGAVRPAIASSSRAPWASTFRCGSWGVHPRPEPPPTRLLQRRSERRCRAPSFLDREVGPDLRQGERAFTRASLGLRLPTDLCNA